MRFWRRFFLSLLLLMSGLQYDSYAGPAAGQLSLGIEIGKGGFSVLSGVKDIAAADSIASNLIFLSSCDENEFWVNLGVVSSINDLGGKAMLVSRVGKSLFQADLQLKKDAKEFLRRALSVYDIDNIEEVNFKFWVKPEKIVIKRDGNKYAVDELKLKVMYECNNEGLSPVMSKAAGYLTDLVNKSAKYSAVRAIAMEVALSDILRKNFSKKVFSNLFFNTDSFFDVISYWSKADVLAGYINTFVEFDDIVAGGYDFSGIGNYLVILDSPLGGKLSTAKSVNMEDIANVSRELVKKWQREDNFRGFTENDFRGFIESYFLRLWIPLALKNVSPQEDWKKLAYKLIDATATVLYDNAIQTGKGKQSAISLKNKFIFAAEEYITETKVVINNSSYIRAVIDLPNKTINIDINPGGVSTSGIRKKPLKFRKGEQSFIDQDGNVFLRSRSLRNILHYEAGHILNAYLKKYRPRLWYKIKKNFVDMVEANSDLLRDFIEIRYGIRPLDPRYFLKYFTRDRFERWADKDGDLLWDRIVDEAIAMWAEIAPFQKATLSENRLFYYYISDVLTSSNAYKIYRDLKNYSKFLDISYMGEYARDNDKPFEGRRQIFSRIDSALADEGEEDLSALRKGLFKILISIPNEQRDEYWYRTAFRVISYVDPESKNFKYIDMGFILRDKRAFSSYMSVLEWAIENFNEDEIRDFIFHAFSHTIGSGTSVSEKARLINWVPEASFKVMDFIWELSINNFIDSSLLPMANNMAVLIYNLDAYIDFTGLDMVKDYDIIKEKAMLAVNIEKYSKRLWIGSVRNALAGRYYAFVKNWVRVLMDSNKEIKNITFLSDSFLWIVIFFAMWSAVFGLDLGDSSVFYGVFIIALAQRLILPPKMVKVVLPEAKYRDLMRYPYAFGNPEIKRQYMDSLFDLILDVGMPSRNFRGDIIHRILNKSFFEINPFKSLAVILRMDHKAADMPVGKMACYVYALKMIREHPKFRNKSPIEIARQVKRYYSGLSVSDIDSVIGVISDFLSNKAQSPTLIVLQNTKNPYIPKTDLDFLVSIISDNREERALLSFLEFLKDAIKYLSSGDMKKARVNWQVLDGVVNRLLQEHTRSNIGDLDVDDNTIVKESQPIGILQFALDDISQTYDNVYDLASYAIDELFKVKANGELQFYAFSSPQYKDGKIFLGKAEDASILLYKSIKQNEVAAFHEVMEWLAKTGKIWVEVNDDKKKGKNVVIRRNNKDGDILCKVKFKDNAVNRRWVENAKNGSVHYALRIVQRMLFGEKDVGFSGEVRLLKLILGLKSDRKEEEDIYKAFKLLGVNVASYLNIDVNKISKRDNKKEVNDIYQEIVRSVDSDAELKAFLQFLSPGELNLNGTADNSGMNLSEFINAHIESGECLEEEDLPFLSRMLSQSDTGAQNTPKDVGGIVLH